MKIARAAFALPLALLAAAPALAAVPPPKPPVADAPDSERDAQRGRAIGVCVGDLNGAENVTPDELEAICGCAVDRLLRVGGGEPPTTSGQNATRGLLGSQLMGCAMERRPAMAAAIARRLAAPPRMTVPTVDSKPAAEPEPEAAPPEPPKSSGPGFGEWLSGLSPSAWLGGSSLPVWAWGLLGLLGFLMLRGLFRRDDRRDLDGPPPSMRRAQRVLPQPPGREQPPRG